MEPADIAREPKDSLLAQGTLGWLPSQIRVTDREPAVLFLEDSTYEEVPSLALLGKDGKLRWKLNLGDIFEEWEVFDFPIDAEPIGGGRGWCEGWWIDEESGKVVLLTRSRLVREVDLSDGAVSLSDDRALLRRLCRGPTSERLQCLDLAAIWLPRGLRRVARIIEKDETEPLAVRLRASVAVLRTGGEPAAKQLFRGAVGPEIPEDTRHFAVVHMGEILGAEAIPELARILMRDASGAPEAKRGSIRALAYSAVRGLSRSGDPAIPVLATGLLDEKADPHLGEHIARTLGSMGSRKAVPVLIQIAAGGEPKRGGPPLDMPGLRVAAVQALAALGELARSAGPLLLRLQGHENRWIREAATEALGKTGQPASKVVPALVEAVSDPSWLIQRAALRSLQSFGSDARPAVGAVRRVLREGPAVCWSGAVDALAAIGPQALPAAQDLIDFWLQEDRSGDWHQLETAITSVGKGAIPLVSKVFLAAPEETRIRAIALLARFEPHADTVVPIIERALQDESADIRLAGIRALESLRLRATGALPSLLKAFRDESLRVREGAAWAIGACSTHGRGFDLLLKGLKDEHPTIRAACANGLGLLRGAPRSPLDILWKLTADRVPEVRAAAVEAIGFLATPSRITVRRTQILLGDESPLVRAAAAATLEQMNTPGRAALPALRALRDNKDEDEDVRLAAAWAIRSLTGE